ncbi:hypothetical protein HELRODRAFT_62592 [Helobdella robusta]|uniref:Glycosyl hydrolase family 13 catalytic domain-containing protein n=1 Tax=Helobdella robusta TaxID=6412 RepID=T1FX26_HELRO|nr:hypothetical protein HELRODRAFT_62592 [Helobdella robusta]ESO12206.1 hypothetical protein HELRODRAFT_62592 [Helobdella robusta]
MSKRLKIGSNKDWWKHVIVYQIYPRSFQDTTGNGIGDLQGIINHLDYFVFLNVEAIWLSPIYCSPMIDHGYDVSNYRDIDPLFGSLHDFEDLIHEAHKRDIKVIMDFIPNHTSTQHQWFINSCKDDSGNPYRDYYIWKDGKVDEEYAPGQPNNWLSAFNGPAWTWNEDRQQFYLHQFTAHQPDLNLRNPSVVKELLDILQFWLDRDVDGFRMDAIMHLFKDERFLDEPRSNKSDASPDSYDYLEHVYTVNQPEVHDLLQQFRVLFNAHEQRTGKYIFMVTEVFSSDSVECAKYYHSGSDMSFNFSLTSLHKKNALSGSYIRKEIELHLQLLPEGKWPNFVLGNHDISRVATRTGLQYADLLNVLLLTLPGTAFTYYGEELAMLDIELLPYEHVQDPFAKNLGPEKFMLGSRDPCRAPMQWSDDVNAGFSSSKHTWLPVHPSYKCRNVQAQKKQEISHLNIYKRIAAIRQHEVFKNGLITFHVVNENILSFFRHKGELFNSFARNDDEDESDEVFLVAMNVGFEISTYNYAKDRYKSAFVLMNTESSQMVNTSISLQSVLLKPAQALVLKILLD